MTIAEIAKKHGVSVESIESELRMGLEVEKEHTESYAERKQYALDHLEEIPDYYTRLKKMEKEAEKDERKEDEGLHDEEVGKAFDKWTKLGEKLGGPIETNEKSEEEYFPTVSLKVPGKKSFAVGEEIEAEFKCCVSSVRKDKDGMRIELELKEAKFE